MNYFENIVNRLTVNDLFVMNALYENECVSKSQSIGKVEILDNCPFKSATLYRVINRLELLSFIEVFKYGRQYHYCLTQHGLAAIHSITERVEA